MWNVLLRERLRVDLVMLRDRPRLDDSGKLRLLHENQPLLHVFLAPLHPAPSSASLLVASPIASAFRFRVRTLCR